MTYILGCHELAALEAGIKPPYLKAKGLCHEQSPFMRQDTNKPAHQVGYSPACAAHRFAAYGLLRLVGWLFACNNYIINTCDRSSIIAG